MPTKETSNVDAWLKRETLRTRKALESASRHFDADDGLTVNTLEAVYGQESSFGTQIGTRGSPKAAGHFRFEPATARRYGLSVSKENDQRFDIHYASCSLAWVVPASAMNCWMSLHNRGFFPSFWASC